MKFLTPLVIRQVGLDQWNKWKLQEPLRYRCKNQKVYTIPKDFISDGATVPFFLWGIFPPLGRYAKAAMLHDYLIYQHRSEEDFDLTRKDIDDLFYESLKACGVSKPRAWIMWAAVVAFRLVKGGK